MTNPSVLGVGGLVLSVLFAITAAVPQQPRGWVIGSAIVVGGVAIVWLLIRSLPWLYDWSKRRSLRNQNDLQIVSFNDQEKAPSQIDQTAWFGFETIFACAGLTEQDPDPNNHARIKRTRGGSQYVAYAFPLEVHGYSKATYLVGYVTGSDKDSIDRRLGEKIRLWMRPVWRGSARNLVEIPLEEIAPDEGSRGLGTWRSASFLELQLRGTSNVDPAL